LFMQQARVAGVNWLSRRVFLLMHGLLISVLSLLFLILLVQCVAQQVVPESFAGFFQNRFARDLFRLGVLPLPIERFDQHSVKQRVIGGFVDLSAILRLDLRPFAIGLQFFAHFV